MNQYIIALALVAVLVLAAGITLTASPRPVDDDTASKMELLQLKQQKLEQESAGDEVNQATQAELAAIKAELRELTNTPGATDGPFIEPIEVNGGDIALVLGTDPPLANSMWKYAFRLPVGQYTNHFWAEIWTVGSDKPRVIHLSTLSSHWNENQLLIKRPHVDFPQEFVQIGEHIYYNTNPQRIELDTRVPPFTERLKSRHELRAGEPVHLVTVKQGPIAGGKSGLKDVHNHYETVIYFKTHFVEGDFVKFTNPYEAAPADTTTPPANGDTPTPAPTNN